MAHDDPMVHVRMPAAMKQALENAAKGEQRTLTAEICYRLEKSLEIQRGTEGISEPSGDYALSSSALDSLPEDLRSAAVRLLCAAANGVLIGDGKSGIQIKQESRGAPKPRNSVPSGKKTRPPRSQLGNGSER